MSAVQVVTKPELGNELDWNTLEGGKLHVRPGPGLAHGPGFVDLRLTQEVLPMLPPPRVALRQEGGSVAGLLRNGMTGYSDQLVRVSLEDVPALLLDPAYAGQIELMRYRKSDRRKDPATGLYKKKGTRWVHPSPCTATGAPVGAHSFGTRYGRHLHVSAARATEWALPGSYWSHLDLRVIDVFGPWFFPQRYDDSFGNSISVPLYVESIGKSTRRGQRGVSHGGHVYGKFAFRYAVVDPSSGRRLVGPLSATIKVGPFSGLTFVHDVTDSNVNGWLLEVNTRRDGDYRLRARIVS